MVKYELDERTDEEIIKSFLTPATGKFKDFDTDEEIVIKFKFIKTDKLEQGISDKLKEIE